MQPGMWISGLKTQQVPAVQMIGEIEHARLKTILGLE
jgi:hypothetical protein